MSIWDDSTKGEKKSKKIPTGFASPRQEGGEEQKNSSEQPADSAAYLSVPNPLSASIFSQPLPEEPALRPPPPPLFETDISLPSLAVIAQQVSGSFPKIVDTPVLVASTGHNTSAVVMQDSLSSELHTVMQSHCSHRAAPQSPSAPSPPVLNQNFTPELWEPNPVPAGRISDSMAMHAAALASQDEIVEQLISGDWEKEVAEIFANTPDDPRFQQPDSQALQQSQQSDAVPPPVSSSVPAPTASAEPSCPSSLAIYFASQGLQDESNTKKNAIIPSSVATVPPSSSPLSDFFASTSSMSAPTTNADPPYPSLLSNFFASQKVQDETNSKKNADTPSSNGQKATILAETKKKSVQCSVVPKRRGKVEVIDPKTRKSTTPQEYFDSILSSRGYSTKVYSSLDCGYHSKPSPLQIASFGAEVLQAVEKNDAPKLSKLLRSGLSRNPCSSFSDGTLARAIKRGHFEAFRAQLEAGAAVHVADDFGRTLLHYAAWAPKTCFKTVKAILEVDASMLRVSDRQGKTPFDYLTSRNAQGWVDFLERMKDRHWPHRGARWKEAEAVPKAARAGEAALPDPDDALHVDLARMVAAGHILPESLEGAKSPSVTTVKEASGEKLLPLLPNIANGMSTNKRKLGDIQQTPAELIASKNLRKKSRVGEKKMVASRCA